MNIMNEVNNKNIFYIDIYTAHINISFTFCIQIFHEIGQIPTKYFIILQSML